MSDEGEEQEVDKGDYQAINEHEEQVDEQPQPQEHLSTRQRPRCINADLLVMSSFVPLLGFWSNGGRIGARHLQKWIQQPQNMGNTMLVHVLHWDGSWVLGLWVGSPRTPARTLDVPKRVRAERAEHAQSGRQVLKNYNTPENGGFFTHLVNLRG